MKVEGPIKDLTCTQKALAQALGISQQRVSQLIREEIIVKNPQGEVKLFDSIYKYLTKSTSKDNIDYWEEKAKHERAKRELTELKLKEQEQELYPADIVELVMSEQLLTLKRKLQSIPSKLALKLSQQREDFIKDELTKEIDECLESISEYQPDLFKEVKDDENSD